MFRFVLSHSILFGLVLSISIATAVAKPAPQESLLTTAELKAIAKYDDLPDEWRDKAIEAWKRLYESSKRSSRLLKNDPPVYPFILMNDAQGNVELKPDAWGVLAYGGKFTGRIGVDVVQVLDKQRVLCQFADQTFLVEGVDTSRLINGKFTYFRGLFRVHGTDTYITTNGEERSVRLMKPLPQKNVLKNIPKAD